MSSLRKSWPRLRLLLVLLLIVPALLPAQTVPNPGSGGGGSSVTAAGANGQCALFSGVASLVGDTGCTYSGTGATYTQTFGGGIVLGDGSAAAPAIRFTNATGTGLSQSAGGLQVSYGGSVTNIFYAGDIYNRVGQPRIFLGPSDDVALTRKGAGVAGFTDGGTATFRSLLGGGAAVASASALPLPTGRVFHVTGTTNITSITSTSYQAGVIITLIFDGVLTFTDGNNLALAGNFVTTADDTITLAYDGTNWYETGRSVN